MAAVTESVLTSFEKEVLNSNLQGSDSIISGPVQEYQKNQAIFASELASKVSLGTINKLGIKDSTNIKENEDNLIVSDNEDITTGLTPINTAVSKLISVASFKSAKFSGNSMVPTIENDVVGSFLDGCVTLGEKLNLLLKQIGQIGNKFEELDFRLAKQAEDFSGSLDKEGVPTLGTSSGIAGVTKVGSKGSTTYSYYKGKDVQENPMNEVVEDTPRIVEKKPVEPVTPTEPETKVEPETPVEPVEPVTPTEPETPAQIVPGNVDNKEDDGSSKVLKNILIAGGIGAAVGVGAYAAHQVIANKTDSDYEYERSDTKKSESKRKDDEEQKAFTEYYDDGGVSHD